MDDNSIESTLRRIDELTKEFGPRSEEVLDWRFLLAQLTANSGQFVQARFQLHSLLALANEVLSFDDSRLFEFRGELCLLESRMGNTMEAEFHCQSLVEDVARIRGPYDDSTFMARLLQAQVIQESGHLSQAIDLLKLLVSDLDEHQEGDEQIEIDAEMFLAGMLADAGRLDESKSLYQRLIARTADDLEEDSDNWILRNNLAHSLQSWGLFDEAIQQFELLINDVSRLYGSKSKETLTERSNLAIAKQSAGYYTKAVKDFETLLIDEVRIFGEKDVRVFKTRRLLASALWEIGEFSRCLEIERILIEDLTAVLGPDHPETFQARTSYAFSLLYTDKPNDAETIIEKVLADKESLFGYLHPQTLETREDLIRVKSERGSGLIVKPLRELCRDKAEILGPDHPSTLESQAALADFLAEYGRRDEANDLFELLMWRTERVMGPNHPEHLRYRFRYAKSLANFEERRESLDRVRSILDDCQRLLGPNHEITMEVVGYYCLALKSAMRKEDAIELLEKLVTDLRDSHSPESRIEKALALLNSISSP